jgi:hypothetical protein
MDQMFQPPIRIRSGSRDTALGEFDCRLGQKRSMLSSEFRPIVDLSTGNRDGFWKSL